MHTLPKIETNVSNSDFNLLIYSKVYFIKAYLLKLANKNPEVSGIFLNTTALKEFDNHQLPGYLVPLTLLSGTLVFSCVYTFLG